MFSKAKVGPRMLFGGRGVDPSGVVVKHGLDLSERGLTRGICTSSKVGEYTLAKVSGLSHLLYLRGSFTFEGEQLPGYR